MKKKILIILLILVLIIIGVVIANKILLNNNEKEILAVLKDLDYSLQNPPPTEDDTIKLRPTEPITLKEYIHTILEIRKLHTENGNLSFLFKVVLKDNHETILIVSNGELVGMTLNPETLETTDTNTDEEDNWADTLVNTYLTTFINKTNELITENWNKAIVVENVNFTKVLNKI